MLIQCVFLIGCGKDNVKTYEDDSETTMPSFGASDISPSPVETLTPSVSDSTMPAQSTTTPDTASPDISPNTPASDTTTPNQMTPDPPKPDLLFLGWEYFLNNDLQTAEYTGVWEAQSVDFSNFDAAAQCDIDGDGETELILRYIYSYFLIENRDDLEIVENAYIILKNNDGYIVEVAGFWNEYTYYHFLRYSGQHLIIGTSYWLDAAGGSTVYSVYSDGKFIEYFSYTVHADYASYSFDTLDKGPLGPVVAEIIEENGVEYIVLWGMKEKYLGFHDRNHYSTSDFSINTYEELMARIDEINSYPSIEFNLKV
jgi:hypothetical protein